jgi:hypothetical protein
MGYSISQTKWERLERNRRDGRLCGGATSAPGGCATRATVIHSELFWVHRIGEGEPRPITMRTCARHAMPVGYQGVNFRITARRDF